MDEVMFFAWMKTQTARQQRSPAVGVHYKCFSDLQGLIAKGSLRRTLLPTDVRLTKCSWMMGLQAGRD